MLPHFLALEVCFSFIPTMNYLYISVDTIYLPEVINFIIPFIPTDRFDNLLPLLLLGHAIHLSITFHAQYAVTKIQ